MNRHSSTGINSALDRVPLGSFGTFHATEQEMSGHQKANEKTCKITKALTVDEECHGIDNNLTLHASRRMANRGLSQAAVMAAIEYGRLFYVRGAAISAIGRKEVKRFAQEGVDLSRYEGIQVVCTPGGTVLTAYRNRDFHGLRYDSRR